MKPCQLATVWSVSRSGLVQKESAVVWVWKNVQELWRVRAVPPPSSLSVKVPPSTYRPVTAPDTLLAMLTTDLDKASLE